MPSKVYYNSACPVCDAGIKNQRRRMEAASIKDIEWVDVHTNPDAVSEVGSSLEQVRERLYVKDTNGQLSIGVDAFVHLWQHTPGLHWLAKLFQLPILKQLMHLVYNVFAHFLYKWNLSKKRW